MKFEFTRTIRTIFKPFKWPILALSFTEIIIAGMLFITPYITKLVVDEIAVNVAPNWTYIRDLAILAILLELVRDIFRRLQMMYSNIIFLKIEKIVSLNGLTSYLHIPVSINESSNSALRYNQITNGTQASLRLFRKLTRVVVRNVSEILVGLVILFYMNVTLGAFAILSVTLITLGISKFESYSKALQTSTNNTNDVYYSSMLESMRNSRSVQTMALIQDRIQLASNKFKIYASFYNEYWVKLMTKVLFTGDMLFNIFNYGAFAYGLFAIYTNQITLGSFILLLSIVKKIIGSVYTLFNEIPYVLDSTRRIDKYLDIVNEDQVRTGGIRVRAENSITFNDLSFSYSDKTNVLENINFTINPGERVALVGPSGAGKSTIIKLLYGHYEPKSGEIKIGDVSLSEISLNSLRKYLSLVPQDIELFDDSIKSNISIGLGKITEKDLVQASTQAAFHDFVQTLDEGYETMIGERGLKLSGGQRQRLAIARALIRKPKLLVLDEATSSLDSESEFYIQEALKNIDHSQTMLIIAHRLSTIKHCDKIIVLDQGKIVEQGSHDELLANEGLYAKLVALQDKGKL